MRNSPTPTISLPVDRLFKKGRKAVDRENNKHPKSTAYALVINIINYFIHVLSTTNISLQRLKTLISTQFLCSTTTTILNN